MPKNTISKQSIIDDVIKILPKKPEITNFAYLYLNKITEATLLKHTVPSLSTFISERYDYAIKHLGEKDPAKYFSTKRNKNSDKLILELICQDAPYILATIEAVLKEHHILITQMHHPIMTIEKNKGKLSAIKKPTEKSEKYAVIYIEIEHTPDKKIVESLEKEIKQKLQAVQCSFKDYTPIINHLMKAKKEIATYPEPLPKFHQEWVDLCDWLKNYNFSFFGYCCFEYELNKKGPDHTLVKNSECGILSDDYSKIDTTNLKDVLKAHSWRLKNYRSPFIFDTIEVKCPAQRFENLMRLSLKIPKKNTIIEHNFIGLLKRSSLTMRNLETPIIRLKMETIFKEKHILPGTYDFNQIIRLFTATPKFELFRTPTENLMELVEDLLSITNPNDIYCFTRRKIEPNHLFLMIVIPPQLFTEKTIQKILVYLKEKIPLTIIETIRASGEQLCRLHIYFDQIDKKWDPDCNQIQDDIKELIKPWSELLRQTINIHYPGSYGKKLHTQYASLFPTHYKMRRTPSETVRDIYYLEKVVAENDIQFNLVPFVFLDSVLTGKTSILFIYNKKKIDLIDIMPTLQNLNLHVFDELTTRIGGQKNTIGYIHSFRVTHKNGEKIDENSYKTLLTDTLKAVFKKQTANDPLNGLTLKAYLSWRHINILQTYRSLILQLGSQYSKDKTTETLLLHTKATQTLVQFFETKFSIDKKYGSIDYRNNILLPKIKQEFMDILTKVTDIADDIILKRFFNLIDHTLRTNYFIEKEPNNQVISIKLDSQKVKMISPSPYREIFVHDSEMEGTHLRFGKVARGGLRWSNRPDDFRTEVLGLVKTQQTKNVVIVPSGSKGGFVIKKQLTSKDDIGLESQKQYKKFIQSLLDITDTLNSKGQIKTPKQVLVYDEHDPYLVVAADKGTAQFSDLANAISEKYNFWLGDAFASGGSTGYNHKAVGITAKGCWECVKLHFKELNIDIQTEPFTVTGIGDMSGDVFGNGMLLSRFIKLQAAFNHAHIFIDPTPDPEKSYKERERLFNLPHSAWTDYNNHLISKGGGVFDRKAKEIAISEEMKKLLNIKKSTLNGEELLKTILKIKTDLLWFGGIGTYIKSENESHFQVSDPANDSIRINASECNAKVIGEGANLGITQTARTELNKNYILLNTDFIDNSAGVNMSDYEVNIKILLKRLLENNHIKSTKERNSILEKATDEVTELVLKNNRGQHRLISMDSMRSRQHFAIYLKLIHQFTVQKILIPAQENIPDSADLEDFGKKNKGLPRPILATLQAYAKMTIFNHLVTSPILNDTHLEHFYIHYFPKSILKNYIAHIHTHHLKKEILSTVITNKIINQAGISFFFEIEHLTGRSISDIALAYLIINQALEADIFRKNILTSTADTQAQYLALIEFEHHLKSLVIDNLQSPHLTLSFKWISSIKKIIDTFYKNISKSIIKDKEAYWQKKGFSKDLATTISKTYHLSNIADLLYLQEQEKLDPKTSLNITLLLDTLFKFNIIKDKASKLHLTTSWEYSQKEILMQNIRFQKINLIKFLVKTHSKETLAHKTKESILTHLQNNYPSPIGMYFQSLDQLTSESKATLTSLSVVISRLNFIAFTQ